jgi:hypothetical protein
MAMIVTIIGGFIAAHFAAILGLLGGAGGILFGLFKHQQAKAATAQANAAIAKVGEQQAQSEAVAQQHAAQVVQVAAKDHADAAKVPADQLDQQLKDLGGLRND